MTGKRFLVMSCRLFVGLVFLYASSGKILDPPAFVKEIAAYRMVPPVLLNVMAVYLPWIEAAAGLFLVLGVWVRTSAIFTSAMLFTFIAAIGLRFAGGETDFECGCFPHTPGFIDDIPGIGQLFSFFFSSKNAQVTFARDLVLVAMSLVVVRWPWGWRRMEDRPVPRSG